MIDFGQSNLFPSFSESLKQNYDMTLTMLLKGFQSVFINYLVCIKILSAPPSCAEERKRVFKSIREGDLLRLGLFIPECDPDGSYSEVQCSQNKRLCWCVDKHGVEVDDTRVQLKRPDCRCELHGTQFPKWTPLLKPGFHMVVNVS